LQIAERVSQETDFRNLVKRPAAEATRLISTSKSVLDSWSDVYLQVREKIEVSGRDPRQAFFSDQLNSLPPPQINLKIKKKSINWEVQELLKGCVQKQ
jgi:hypothetical protein